MFSIIVPIKNQYKIVKMCLDSIVKFYVDKDIILVDDGSDEQATLNLLKDYSIKYNWKLFRNNNSIGHSGACTIGINNSKYENVFLLNSDIIVTSKVLTILSNVLDKYDDVGCAGPYTCSASGDQMIKELYDKRYAMKEDQIEKVASDLEVNTELKDISLVNGFCMVLRKSLFKKLGGFCAELSSYGNEKEFQIRMRKAGFRTVLVNSYVHHFGKVSYSKENINISQCQKDADRLILKLHGKLA